MTRSEKAAAIEDLKVSFEENPFFYITDASTLSVAQVNNLRALCFEKGVTMKVVKNTLAIKALESFDEERNFAPLYDALKGPTALMFCETANVPARVIKEFRKSADHPVLKAAYIESAIFKGDNQIDNLASLKSKEELVGDVIGLLQSPAKNVISALKSGGSTIAGLIKALEERG
ncbi:MAG: 50S ribosomal protein L10 [Saprospiraceae bacterium]